MKTNILANNTIMKKYTKYICAVLLVVGTSVSAWGTCNLYGGLGGNTLYTSIADDASLPTTAPEVEGWTFTGAWCTSKYGGSDGSTTFPSGSYIKWKGSTPGGSTTLYAVYSSDCSEGSIIYIGAPYIWYYIDLTPRSGDSYAEVVGGKYCYTKPGETVTILATPDDGVLDISCTVLDGSANEVTVTKVDDTHFTFTMPSSEVYVDVSFTACTDRTLSFSNDEIIKDYGASAGQYQNYSLSAGSGTIKWSSDDSTIASVNESTGVVTIHKAGWTYINAAVATDGTYCPDEGFYKITVNALTPTLATDVSGKEFAVSAETAHGATFSGGVVTSKGNATITRYGFVIGTSSTVVVGGTGADAPVIGTYWSDDIALNTAFGSKTATTGLTAGTTYYARPWAYNGKVYGYGTAVSFTTLNEYNIDLDKNNSDVGSIDGLATVEENGTRIEIIAPSREHYTVEGYYTTSACETKIANTTGELVANITVGGNDWTDGDGKWIRDADETFYANWTADNHTISFNANGGSGSMDAVIRGYNTAYALPACGFTAPSGKVFDGWAEGSAEGTIRSVGYEHTVTGNITFYATWRDGSYTDYVFSCAELTLTPKLVTAGTPIFITSTAGKTVRSQDTIQISGTGLTPSTTLTFPNLPSKFEIKKADGSALATNGSGAIEENAFIFYTPGEGDTSDGLDKLTGITVSVSGAKPITKNLTQDIIGRHIATDFVIAGKKDNKWYALPATMSTGDTPTPV